MQAAIFDPGEAVARPRPAKRRRVRRADRTPAFDPLARDNVLQAERELAQTLRLLDRRAKRMAEVTTTDEEEAKEFFRAHPAMRAFPKLRGADVLARCAGGGCRKKWLLVTPRQGRTGVPECRAGKVGADSYCSTCLPTQARAATGRAL